jgi:hypothetical protein
MPGLDPLRPFLEPLDRLGLPYCVTGSVAASVYGEPRLTAWALEHRRRISVAGAGAWIAPPEYVILRKLEYLREGGQDKHVRDIRFIVAGTATDGAFLQTEIARLGLQAQWDRCKAEDG